MVFIEPYRWILATSYGLFAAGGCAALAWPSPAVRGELTRPWLVAWAVLFMVGGASSAWGVWSRHWLGEYVGLLPLASVWLVFGGATGWIAISSHELDRIAGGFGLLAVAVFLVARWSVIARLRGELIRRSGGRGG